MRSSTTWQSFKYHPQVVFVPPSSIQMPSPPSIQAAVRLIVESASGDVVAVVVVLIIAADVIIDVILG